MCACVWWGVYALVVHERSLAKFARVQSCFTRLKFVKGGGGEREGGEGCRHEEREGRQEGEGGRTVTVAANLSLPPSTC